MVESQADEKNNLMLTKSGGATSNEEHPQEFQLPQTEAFMSEEKNGLVATASVDAPHAPPHRLSLRAQVSDATAGRHGKVVLTPRRASGDEMQNNHAKKDLAKMDNDADDFSDLGSTDPEAEATVPVPLPHTGTFVTTCRKKFDGSGWAALLSSVHDTVERTLLNEAARATGLPEVNIRVVDMAMDGASTLVAELALMRDAAVSPESLDAALDAYSFPGMKALLEVKESADSHQPTGLGAAMQGMMERSNGITAESKDEEIKFVDVRNGEHEEDLHHAILSDTDGDSNVGHDDDNADANRSGNSNNDNNAAAAEVVVGHPKAKESKKTKERVAKGMSSPRAVGAVENGAASPMTQRRAGKKYRKATLKNNDQSSPQKQKKLMTPRGGTPTPRAGLSTRRGGTPTPRAGLSTPRGGTPTPRAGLSTRRGGTPTPRAGLSTPRGGTPTPRAGLSTPRGTGPTLLHNSTRFISSMLPWASRLSYVPRFSSHQQPQLMMVGTSADHNTRQRHRSLQRISPMRSHSLRRGSGSDVHSSFGNQSTDMNSSHASRKQHACVRRGSIRPVPPQRVIRVGSPCCSRTPRCSGEPSHVSAMPHLHKAQDTTQPQTTGYTSIAPTTPVWDHDPEPQTCMIIPAENTMASVDLRSERNRSPLEKTPGVSRRSRSPNVPVVSQTSPHRADTEE